MSNENFGAKKKMNYMRLMKNRKAISPIFATLILIAIAVIAGVVVYTFTSGTLSTMTGGGTAGQEKIAVQSAYFTDATPDTVTVILQQTDGPAATVNGLIIKDGSGNTIGLAKLADQSALTTGTLTTISGDVPATITMSGTYTVTVTTEAGGSFVSPVFTV